MPLSPLMLRDRFNFILPDGTLQKGALILLSQFVVFVVLASFEWKYLHDRGRKKRTFIIVFSVLGVVYVYAAIGRYDSTSFINPTWWVEAVFRPIEDFITLAGK